MPKLTQYVCVCVCAWTHCTVYSLNEYEKHINKKKEKKKF